MDVQMIKDRIKGIMEQRNLSYYQLAKMADLTEVCLRNWYAPKRNYTPSLEAILFVCKALGISAAQLMCGEEEELCPVNKRDKEILFLLHTLSKEEMKVVETVISALIKKPSAVNN